LELINVLFFGNSEHNIDPKLRLAIPAKYRNQWSPARDGEAFMSVAWPTGQIRLFTEARFKELYEAAINTLTPTTKQMLSDAALLGMAERVEMDSAGRIALPKKQIERAKLSQEVTVVGMGKRLEVWDRAKWKEVEDAAFEGAQKMVDDAESGKAPT